MANLWNFTIYDGSDFEATLTVTKDGVAVDLSGYSAKIEARASPGSPVLFMFGLGSGILITGVLGQIHLFKSAAETEGLSLVFTSASYDLRLVAPDGSVMPPPVGGTITVAKVITKS